MKETPGLRAYVVSADNVDGAVIVWAQSRPHAKVLGRTSPWFEDVDWIDLKVRREPKADGLRDHACAMDEDLTPEDLRLMWNLGWSEVDGSEESCERCGRYQWRGIPKSTLNENGICAGCAAEEEARSCVGSLS